MDKERIERITLQLLKTQAVDKRMGWGRHFLGEAIRNAAGENLGEYEIQEVYWSLVIQGLAFMELTQRSPENNELRLTAAGRALLESPEFNPSHPSGYLADLYKSVPALSDIVRTYASEAVRAFHHDLYLASTVMLGVASEAAFLELGRAFGGALPEKQRVQFLQILDHPRQPFLARFGEFRKRMETYRNALPDDLSNGLTLVLDSVIDLLRIARNDAGHPTGRPVTKEHCLLSLRVFPPYLERLYRLKTWFEGNRLPNVGAGTDT